MNTDVRTIFDDELIPLCGSLIDTYLTKETNINSLDIDGIREEIIRVLNEIFPVYNCRAMEVVYNFDRKNFGIIVQPVVTDKMALNVLFGEQVITPFEYTVELDLGLLNDINKLELAAYLVEEIEGMMDPSNMKDIAAILDILAANQDTALSIQHSNKAIDLLRFAIIESIRELGSFMRKDGDRVARSEIAQMLEYRNALVTLGLKVKSSLNASGSVVVTPKLSILQWVLEIYKDIQTNYKYARGVLEDAARVTGSNVLRRSIEYTIDALDRMLTATPVNESANIVYEIGLFKALKKSGLKGLENDLYEYKLRVKECKDPDEGAWIMRQLSARITIIEDYLDTEDNLRESERERWMEVSRLYRDLRMELANKKLNKAQYGIFVDYDYLDSKYGD